MSLLPRTIADPAAIQQSTTNYGLGQSRYDFSYRTFPEDLATDYNGHYMVININVPVDNGGQSLSKIPGGGSFASTVLSNDYSKVDKLKFSEYGGIRATNSANPVDANFALSTGTRRIVQSIAIHMPTPVLFNSSHVYEEISLTAIAGQVGKIGASAIGAFLGGAFTRSLAGALGAGSNVGRVFDSARGVIGRVSGLMGYPINPRVEVLFTTTPQRQFAFEILMAPKSENESKSMKAIIETLRFHSAPELTSFGINVLGAQVGIPLFIPPAQFDITFYSKGEENTNIPRISTCVMERIEVDYAPTGVYSTFRNGHPVAARLSMAFREVEILHKARIAQGF